MQAQSIPRMFFERAAARGQRPAQLRKQGAVWEAISWHALSDLVRHIAQGLLALGLPIGDRVAILSASRAEWVQCDLGILAAAGITVPIYPSSTDEQTAYILQNSEATMVFVDTPEQLEKLRRIQPQLPALRQIMLMGGQPPDAAPQVLSLADLIDRGAAAEDQTAELEARLQHLTLDQEATYVYTSGTTGPPKGVVQTHGNHLFMVQSCGAIMVAQEGDVNLLFLPLAHSFARLEEFLGLYVGLTTAFAESIDALAQNMQEVRPMLVFSVPRVYEKIYARVMAAGTSGSPLKQALFRWSVGVGRQISTLQQGQQPVPHLLRWKHALAHKLVFHKLHQTLGGRLRYFVSGGAPLSQEIAEFFHAAGMLILEGYGLTETCPALTANRYDHYKFGTVGTALPGVEVRLAPDGEILARGPNIAQGYYKRPQETAEVFCDNGWFATGDIGELDAEGFLRITDRKKDLIVTAAGKNVAPQNIENRLKTDRYISQAMVYGDRRKYLTAVLTLDLEEIVPYAHEHSITYKQPAELVTHPQIQALLTSRVAQCNQRLASYETIKKFIIAPADFTQESGELTPTLKVKRKVIIHKYQAELDKLYEEE
jgi:long-chain acyl-CoA synthetase